MKPPNQELVPCIVRASRGRKMSSNSGIILSQEHGCVLTHSTFLVPHISHKTPMPSTGILNADVSFSVIVEEGRNFPDNLCSLKDNKLLKPAHPKERILSTLHADYIGSFGCDKFEDDLLKMMPNCQGWKFSETPDIICDDGLEEDDKSKEIHLQMLPVFILLRVQDHYKLCKKAISGKWTLFSSSKLEIGASLYVEGTPFGDASPQIFINSISKGILCNRSDAGTLLLTDARCVPGEEGAIVYSAPSSDAANHNQRYMVGMVVVPLCWKDGEWAGLSICCDIITIISSLHQNFPDYQEMCKVETEDEIVKSQFGPIPPAVKSCCAFVRCSVHWGSGLLLDSRTVLTCSHVVKEKDSVTVYLDGKAVQGKRIFSTPPGDVFDLAVISLDQDICGGYKNLEFANCVTEEEDIYSIGYALFDKHCSKFPTVTKGIVSKVIYANGLPVMIQTDCVINQGASGGVLLKPSGEIVGLIACNCRDTETKASYPHVNLAVPMMTVMPVVKEYLKSRDLGVLDKLHIKSPLVRELWSVDLGEKDLRSKL